MSSSPTILGLKRVFSLPPIDDPAGQQGMRRRYPSPDGALALVCAGSEFRLGAVGWKARLIRSEKDITEEHAELVRILDESKYGLMLNTYQPWSYDGRLLFLANWEGKTYFYNVHNGQSRPLEISYAGVVALGAPTDRIFLVADAKAKTLIDLNGRLLHLTVPCSGMSFFRWTQFPNTLLAIGKHQGTGQSALWFIDGTSGITTDCIVLNPLKLNSKTYQLGELDQLAISLDRAANTLYFRPLLPGAESWALELGFA